MFLTRIHAGCSEPLPRSFLIRRVFPASPQRCCVPMSGIWPEFARATARHVDQRNACPPFVADTFAGGVIMIFNLARVTRFFTSQNRQTAKLASAAPDSRKFVTAGQNRNYQGTPDGSGLFGVLVSNGIPHGRWF